MNLKRLKLILAEEGCQKIYIKELSPNDNSKNQVYFGGNFEILNILPLKEIRNEPAGNWEKERFKSSVDFSWLMDNGEIYPAPLSQLIMYPKYPEIRFSGFLKNCNNPPSQLMSSRFEGRLLFISVTRNERVVGYVGSAQSEVANEYRNLKNLDKIGVFSILELPQFEKNRHKLIEELTRINSLGWINSKRLNSNNEVLSCQSSNCGGYTLEAELGITPNGSSEPDFLGWEVKQFSVKDFSKLNSSIITLMTPEPTHGFYVTDGAESFIRKYGYIDLQGRLDRMNFGGVHKHGFKQARTKLELSISGFDFASGKIRNTDGKIALLDNENNEAASWSFSSLLLHWNKKHNQACYVPSLSEESDGKKYKYGNNVILGMGTDFILFLQQLALGNIYYDPGIKVESISTKPKVKRRSQFRIKSKHLSGLYRDYRTVALI